MTVIYTLRVAVLAALLIWTGYSFGEQKRFPIGVPVMTQAVFCFDLEAAKTLADVKGNYEDPKAKPLFDGRKCGGLRGVAVYVREVYRNGEWAVWELQSGNVGPFYEATNWKGYRPGQVES